MNQVPIRVFKLLVIEHIRLLSGRDSGRTAWPETPLLRNCTEIRYLRLTAIAHP